MGILDEMELDNLPEEKALPDGEYEVVILSAEEYIGKESGKMSIRVILSVPDEPEAQDIFHYISLPQPDDTEKTRFRKMRRIRDFLDAFGLTKADPYDLWVGHKSWALLKQEMDNHGEPRNSVVRFLGRSDNSNISSGGGNAFSDIPF